MIKNINVSGTNYRMVASALFKIKYNMYFNRSIEQDLNYIQKMLRVLEGTGIDFNSLQNFEKLSIEEQTEISKKLEEDNNDFYKATERIIEISSKMAWVMALCGDKQLKLDYEDFLNEIEDYDWILEVIALAGNTFCGWNIKI